MIRQIIHGGVGSGRFPVNANVKVGCVPCYGDVQDVYTVIGFEVRIKLCAAVD
jgi:hypothetical protein